MLYNLNHFELEKIAEIYNVELSQMRELIDFQDDILDFEAFEAGLKVKTQSGQSLTLRFKNKPLDMGGGA